MPTVITALGASCGACGIGVGVAISEFRRWLQGKSQEGEDPEQNGHHLGQISGFTDNSHYKLALEVFKRQSAQIAAQHRAVNNAVASCPPDSPTRSVSQEHFLTVRKIYGLGGFCTHNKLMVCMVGLPARGKSYICKMITRYLTWTGFPVRSFNAGNLRRKDGLASVDASWFSNDEAKVHMREQLATRCMMEALQWLKSQDDVSVAIFDATNSTKKRRRMIWEACNETEGITPLFLESICDDADILERNYWLKLSNDDYKGMDKDKAFADFKLRVQQYESRYETIEDEECDGSIRYIKIFNIGQKVVSKHAEGYAASNIGFYLSNVHTTPRRIWLARHAETEDQLAGILGSTSGRLTSKGLQFCRSLALNIHQTRTDMLDRQENEGAQILVLMGTANVHKSTVDNFCTAPSGETLTPRTREAVDAARTYPVMSTSLLNELDGGDCNGMSYSELQRLYPMVWQAREADKLNYRYPGAGGESYMDVIKRLEPVIVELERHHSSILVISHLAVQRCIYAYFTGTKIDDIPYLDMKMHTVYELNPGPFGTTVETHSL
mmetsp:Transcript_49113/g.116940  ORF Transcript_49113/g.116940 Transcript_49113/m.116940 type:complete len:553 (-) Transcript_49113:55-1713(-)